MLNRFHCRLQKKRLRVEFKIKNTQKTFLLNLSMENTSQFDSSESETQFEIEWINPTLLFFLP